MDGNLKRFLVDTCSDILHGDYKERAQEFVELAKEDQDKAVGIVMAYTRRLKEHTALDLSDPQYLNPATPTEFESSSSGLMAIKSVMIVN